MEHSVITNFDLPRYLGCWREIARFDHSFERGLQGVKACYSLRTDGVVRVENSGHVGSANGKLRRAIGRAKLGSPRDPSNPGFLKVSFFLWFYAPYYILVLDDDYQYALVASRGHKYLWILSRTAHLDRDVVEMLMGIARERGFDTSKLMFVDQHAFEK